MTDHLKHHAWNNFVQSSYPPARSIDKVRRAAAIANLYMGAANNGGINSFLTATPELSTNEILDAFIELDMPETAAQFKAVVSGLGKDLPVSSSDARWKMLEDLWNEGIDDLDCLTEQADAELMRLLERHVAENEEYYAAMRKS